MEAIITDRKNDPLLPPRVVAVLCGVTPHTVARWARSGRLQAVPTAGGHRRYRTSDVQALLDYLPEAVA
ncbi:developmental transcriptional regulator BldC [Nonomuraea antimicrobica]|uniref:Developmental transcriptional regulator BldC n=1 Tax=Nonomuraea antimicrobica TaxID=561173 RepID=A0ABP7DC70_9ACTN